MMTLLMGLSYTDEFEFKNLDYNDYQNNNSSMQYDVIAYNELNNFSNRIIDFVIARCNDGVVDHAESIYEACYYNGGINFLINK